MRHAGHIRLVLFVMLVLSAWVSALAAERQPLAREAAAPATVRSSTRTASRDPEALRPPRELDPLVLAALRDSLVSLALAQLGMPYVMGGATPGRGFDCSGLVRWVTAQMHIRLPRTARLQARIGSPVDRRQLEPGDILAFGDARRISHVGIYVGNGRFVHASSVAGRVIVSPLDRPPSALVRPMRGARRLLATAEGPAGG